MPPTPASRKASRFRALLLLLLLAFGVLALRTWFSPAAREARYSRMTQAALEKEVKGGGDPLALFYLARKRVEAGDAPGGIEALEAALKADPKMLRARVSLATLLMSEDRDEEAALHLKQVIQDDPSDADAYVGMAMLHQRHDAWPLQAQAASAAVQARPTDAEGWMLLGTASERLQDYAKAAGCYQRAAALRPGDANARARAAKVFLKTGKLAEAEKLAESATKADPKAPAGYVALGQVLLRKGPDQLQAAADAFERAASLGDRTGDAPLGLGKAYQEQGRPVEAEQQFRLTLRDNPLNNDARYALARTLRAEGKNEEAAAMEKEFHRWSRFYEQQVALNDRIARPTAKPADWFALARLYADMKLWNQARITVLSGLRRAPADPTGARLLAEIDKNAQ